MKRACIISPNGVSDVGGVERVMLYAARALAEGGYRVRILDRARLERSALGRLSRPLRRGPLGYVAESAALSLLAAATAKDGELLIGNGFSAFLAPADILFCHGSMRGFRFAVKGRRSAGWRPEELLEAAAGRRAKLLAAVSRRAGREWARMYGAPASRIRVLQNTVDDGAFLPDGARRAPGPVRVLFIGRLEIRKGTDRLKRLLDETGSEFSFVVAAPERGGAEWLRHEARVELRIGVKLAELPALYRSCDVMYLPSRYEGFEMVSLEALSSGLPVVGSRVGGVAELAAEGFPGVYPVDAEEPALARAAIMAAAADWREPERKALLHRACAERYGLAAWGRRLRELARDAR